jgi:hypothetical protein
VYFASSCFAGRAVRRSLAFVVSGSFFARRPQVRGIAGHSKQRYRAGWRRCFVLPSNISFKADGFAAA